MTAPTWPWVAKGDQTDVLGRYYYDNPQSQGIDWTITHWQKLAG